MNKPLNQIEIPYNTAASWIFGVSALTSLVIIGVISGKGNLPPPADAGTLVLVFVGITVATAGLITWPLLTIWRVVQFVSFITKPNRMRRWFTVKVARGASLSWALIKVVSVAALLLVGSVCAIFLMLNIYHAAAAASGVELMLALIVYLLWQQNQQRGI